MVLTRSQSAERENKAQQAQTNDPDPREQLKVIYGVQDAAPVSSDNVLLEDYRRISTIPWFSRRAVLTDVESGFGALEHLRGTARSFRVSALTPCLREYGVM